MTVFISHCCAKTSLATWLLSHVVALWLAIAGAGVFAQTTGGIEIRKASLTVSPEEGHVLEAELDIQLTPLLDSVLHKGVPLYFVLEFELIRPRWYWTNEKIISVQQPQRLSFNTLTRQYRVGAGALYQNFATLAEALSFMSRVRRREDIEPNALKKDASYAAALRMRLDATQLPKPFQLSTGRDWNIASDWFRWTVTP